MKREKGVRESSLRTLKPYWIRVEAARWVELYTRCGTPREVLAINAVRLGSCKG